MRLRMRMLVLLGALCLGNGFGCRQQSAIPNKREVLELATPETPRCQLLPTGTMELRFTKPLKIISGYVVGLSYNRNLKEAIAPHDAQISIHQEKESISLDKPGLYFVALLERSPDGKIKEEIVHRFVIIYGPWPQPLRPENEQPLPSDVHII